MNQITFRDGNWLKYEIGDCLECLRSFADGSVDLILTDPPYGQEKMIHSGYGRSELGHRYVHGDQGLDWLPEFIKTAWRVLKGERWLATFVQWRTLEKFTQELCAAGFEIKTVGAWVKENGGLGEGLVEGYESIIFARKGEARERHYRSNIFHYSRPGRQEHPHWKPEGMLAEIIDLLVEPGGTVLDPFLGSGSTLLACRQTGRNGIGIEIDPKYEVVIRRRIMARQRDLWAFSRDEAAAHTAQSVTVEEAAGAAK